MEAIQDPAADPARSSAQTPDELARRAEHLHRMLAFEAANATLDAAIRGHIRAGQLPEAALAARRLAEMLHAQRDYRGAHTMERRAWHLDEGVRALEDAADVWEFDREVAAVHLTVARERFVASGFDEAVAIAADALVECGDVVIDLPRLEFESEEPPEPRFRD